MFVVPKVAELAELLHSVQERRQARVLLESGDLSGRYSCEGFCADGPVHPKLADCIQLHTHVWSSYMGRRCLSSWHRVMFNTSMRNCL